MYKIYQHCPIWRHAGLDDRNDSLGVDELDPIGDLLQHFWQLQGFNFSICNMPT